MKDVASLLRHRQQQAPCVRLTSMIVPFSQQPEATGSDKRLPASANQVTEACALLGVSTSATRAELNRARRMCALRYHPDNKASLANKEWATKKWHEMDATHMLLTGRL